MVYLYIVTILILLLVIGVIIYIAARPKNNPDPPITVSSTLSIPKVDIVLQPSSTDPNQLKQYQELSDSLTQKQQDSVNIALASINDDSQGFNAKLPPQPIWTQEIKEFNTNSKKGQENGNFACPIGSFINEIDVYSGEYLDSIKFKCSDGSSSKVYGGSGGGFKPIAKNDGFSGIIIRSGEWIDSINILDNQMKSALFAGGYGGGNMLDVRCIKQVGNQTLQGVLAGANITYDDHVNTIQPVCTFKQIPQSP